MKPPSDSTLYLGLEVVQGGLLGFEFKQVFKLFELKLPMFLLPIQFKSLFHSKMV